MDHALALKLIVGRAPVGDAAFLVVAPADAAGQMRGARLDCAVIETVAKEGDCVAVLVAKVVVVEPGRSIGIDLHLVRNLDQARGAEKAPDILAGRLDGLGHRGILCKARRHDQARIEPCAGEDLLDQGKTRAHAGGGSRADNVGGSNL